MNNLIIRHSQFVFITLFLLYLLTPMIIISVLLKLEKLSDTSKRIIIIVFSITFIIITICLFSYIDHRINTNIRK